jgi:chorismate synthase
MKNSFGQSITVTLFGESHSSDIGAVVDSFAPGVKVDLDAIRAALNKRRPQGDGETQRRESDDFKIVSGVKDGYTTGTPLCLLIPNADVRSGDYDSFSSLARPSHADYTAEAKYHGYQDKRGGGHFSGRITVALVAVGAIARAMLEQKGVFVGTHILKVGGVQDVKFSDFNSQVKDAAAKDFPVISDVKDEMLAVIDSARNDGDSVGGITETAIVGLNAGLGEPWFDSVESMLSHALFSIGGIKGVQFGAGFDFADMRGSVANDAFYADGGKIFTKTNNNGGINGGITNGMPIVFSCAVKPTPSISKEQDTVDYIKCENARIKVVGRHDPAIIRRVCPVIDAVSALVIADMLATRYGADYFCGAKK